MAIISKSDLTFNGEEIKSLSEAVFESGFAKPAISQFHKVATGIVAKKQIAIMGRLSGKVGKGDGECSPSDGANTVTNTEKFWDPKPISDRLTACWTDLQDTFFIWGLKKGIEKSNLDSTDFLNFIEELLVDAIWEAIYRFAWFGDTDAADVDASPAGVLTSGTDADYFNKIDGFWKQIFAIVGATAARKTTGLASKNGQASYSAQAFDSTDTTNLVVSTTLKNMKYGADSRLRGNANKTYIATQSVVDQLEREYDSLSKVFTLDRLENGMTVFKSSGIEVIAFELWDPENLQVGTEDEGSLTEMDVHYDRVTKKNYIDFCFNLDAKIILDKEIQVAY